MKIISCFVMIYAIVAVGFAHQPEYETFGTDRLTPKQLAKDSADAYRGDREAAHRLGRHYCGMNHQEGLHWLRISAALGSHAAQVDFFVYAKGMNGNSLLRLEGKVWLKKACDAGYRHALLIRDANLKHGQRSEVELE